MKYYLIGIKGSGMSALAIILKQLNNEVVGSDVSDYFFTQKKLEDNNITILKFNEENLQDSNYDVIIYGNAISKEHLEYKEALNTNARIMKYNEFINELSNDYQSIAIAGTNGKTTTTGICNMMFSDVDHITLIGDGTGFAKENSKIFIFEACEYQNVFHNYNPTYAFINNIEMDHPDFFVSEDQVVDSFQKFASNSKNLIINYDDLNCQKIKHDSIISYGIENEKALVNVTKYCEDDKGITFDLETIENKYVDLKIPFYGKHMLYNTISNLALAYKMGYDIEKSLANIIEFSGVQRRFEIDVLNQKDGLILIDDYAHHPTAITYTIEAIKNKYPDYEVSILFQPHTYSRTKLFLTEFAESLLDADNLYLVEIFGSVREEDTKFSIDILKEEIEKHNKIVYNDLEFLKEKKNNHVIALLGAGDIDKLYKGKIKEIYGIIN